MLDNLANDIAALSNDDLDRLAMLLVKDYAPRAEYMRSALEFSGYIQGEPLTLIDMEEDILRLTY
jgi:hypothetical protein